MERWAHKPNEIPTNGPNHHTKSLRAHKRRPRRKERPKGPSQGSAEPTLVSNTISFHVDAPDAFPMMVEDQEEMVTQMIILVQTLSVRERWGDNSGHRGESRERMVWWGRLASGREISVGVGRLARRQDREEHRGRSTWHRGWELEAVAVYHGEPRCVTRSSSSRAPSWE
uniref:Uncharacterized protein n=1 Tax=Oryza punctata TaxID=4537 RepID=A0A0E0L080_ORYPU